jgi:S-adenosylmethionine synthetase
MEIDISQTLIHPSNRRLETVERKGLGHPDTMADLMAEAFSRLYSRYCLENFGHILNHAVDKLTLVGLSTICDFGGFAVVAPGEILLIGNITPAVGAHRIPVFDLLRAAVQHVVSVSLVDDSIVPALNLSVVNTYSSAQDRPRNFFLPLDSSEAAHVGEGERGANDTVFCTAVAPYSPLESLVLELESAVTGPAGRQRFRGIGTDVKVLATRRGRSVDVTVCVPVLPAAARDRDEYRALLEPVTQTLQGVIDASPFEAKLSVNTKDREGGCYLAPYGTALGKSDCGAVGRGNRQGGVISAFRPANVEAPAGKNPLHHAGKLYTLAAEYIASDIWALIGAKSAVTIATSNGTPITTPELVAVECADGPGDTEKTTAIVEARVGGMNDLGPELVRSPLVESGWTVLPGVDE